MKKSVIIWIHVGFWCAFALFLLSHIFLAQQFSRIDFNELSLILRLQNYAKPIIFYASYFLTYLVLKNKKNIGYFLLFFLILFLYPLFAGLHNILFNFMSLVYAFEPLFLGTSFCLGIDWYKKKEQKKELEKQNLQSELKLLKNQVNPHFLFNTLNNIDSLIRSNPDKASSMLVGMSGMMRYMIYDTNSNISPFSQELQQIRNYIDLQKMQYANPDLVAYSEEGNPEGIEVAPMLFIPFIENAFKHCTDKTVKYAIQFSFKIEEKIIYFESKNISNFTQHIEKDSTRGIGLETVKRRLELLYPNKHQLQIDEKNNIFAVSLTLDTQ